MIGDIKFFFRHSLSVSFVSNLEGLRVIIKIFAGSLLFGLQSRYRFRLFGFRLRSAVSILVDLLFF